MRAGNWFVGSRIHRSQIYITYFILLGRPHTYIILVLLVIIKLLWNNIYNTESDVKLYGNHNI